MIIQNSHKNQHNNLFLKLKILFAGWQPESTEVINSAQQHFVHHILYNSYKFVIDLRMMRDSYEKIRDNQKITKKCDNLLQKIYMFNTNGSTKKLAKIQTIAIRDQIQDFSVYAVKINREQKGIFSDLDCYLDISKQIKEIHLRKSNAILPAILQNLTTKRNTKQILQNDFDQTKQIYEGIENAVDKRLKTIDNFFNHHQNFFGDLSKQLDDL